MKSTTKKPVTSVKKSEPVKVEGIPTDVHERLLALLQANNVRQVDFAKAMKKSKDWASRTMSGERGLSVETLVKLSNVFGINIHWLLTGTGEMYIKGASEASDPIHYLDDVMVRLKQLKKLLAPQ